MPCIYRYIEKEYVDDFFDSGNFLISNFDKCKKLEDLNRRDENEGINSFIGTCENYKTELKMGIGDNPFLICTSLYGPDSNHKEGKKINNPVEFSKCVCNKLRKLGYIIENIDMGLCFYTNKAFEGLIHKKTIDNIVNARECFDFRLLPNLAKQINANSYNMYFNKDIIFKEEQEFRIVFRYNSGQKEIPNPFIINIKEAIPYCEKASYKG